jgi:hypothetical protein
MPEGNQDHGGIPGAVPIALGGIDQLLDLALGQVFAWSDLAVWAPDRSNCPISFAGDTSLRCVFSM